MKQSNSEPNANAISTHAEMMLKGRASHIDQFRSDWERLRQDRSIPIYQHHTPEGSRSYEIEQRRIDRFEELRGDAFREFERIGFPTRRRGNELWKYTDLRSIDQQRFLFGIPSASVTKDEIAAKAPWSDEWMNIVIIDGRLSSDLSNLDYNTYELMAAGPPNITVGPLLCHPVYEFEVEPYCLGDIADYRENAFVALNTAFLSDGIALSLNADMKAEERPINLVFVTTASSHEPRAVYPRARISMDEDSSATVIETHISLASAPYITAPVLEVELAEGASLKHYRLQLDAEQAFHFGTTRVRQASGSDYRSVSFAIGSAIGRNDIHSLLDGENAECDLKGVYITTNQQHQDNEVSTTHTKPGGTSRQYYKGILAGDSRAVFSGKIVVERGAQKTDADQKDLNLLLSHGCEVDTKPSLEIYADDVKCAHGATAGHVDEDTLFYLQSRGIDYQAAQAMLIRGFAAEILDEFKEPDLRASLDQLLDDMMPQLQASSDTIGTA